MSFVTLKYTMSCFHKIKTYLICSFCLNLLYVRTLRGEWKMVAASVRVSFFFSFHCFFDWHLKSEKTSTTDWWPRPAVLKTSTLLFSRTPSCILNLRHYNTAVMGQVQLEVMRGSACDNLPYSQSASIMSWLVWCTLQYFAWGGLFQTPQVPRLFSALRKGPSVAQWEVI